jgi:hypothetical protein
MNFLRGFADGMDFYRALRRNEKRKEISKNLGAAYGRRFHTEEEGNGALDSATEPTFFPLIEIVAVPPEPGFPPS